MRSIDYQSQIKEGLEELKQVEQQQSSARLRDRVRLLRFFKSGKAATQQDAAELVGLTSRQVQKLWQLYKREGLEALLQTHYKGSWSKLSAVEQARLLQRLDADDIITQAQLLAWLRQETGISYSQSGLSCLLARLKVKLKTGRPVNVRKDQAGEATFKKTSHS